MPDEQTPGRRIPPPVPNRRARTTPNYGPMFGAPYGSYGTPSFSPMGRLYNNAYGTGPFNGRPLSNFVRLAEDSSRPAFESMENIVQAFGSIAMVLESTHFAVQSSFRAVLGLAEHFSRLRVQMTQLLSNLALFRTLRYLYRKLLTLLGLRSQHVSDHDDAWTESVAAKFLRTTSSNAHGRNKSSWPLVLFLCIVIGGPYLIWRLMASINENSADEWKTGVSEHFVAVAEFDYEADQEDEISFVAGQEIKVAPKCLQPRMKGWLLACVDGEKSGLIPANYVKIRGKRAGRSRPTMSQSITRVPAIHDSRRNVNCDMANDSIRLQPRCQKHPDNLLDACKQQTKSAEDIDDERAIETESSSANESEFSAVPVTESALIQN